MSQIKHAQKGKKSFSFGNLLGQHSSSSDSNENDSQQRSESVENKQKVRPQKQLAVEINANPLKKSGEKQASKLKQEQGKGSEYPGEQSRNESKPLDVENQRKLSQVPEGRQEQRLAQTLKDEGNRQRYESDRQAETLSSRTENGERLSGKQQGRKQSQPKDQEGSQWPIQASNPQDDGIREQITPSKCHDQDRRQQQKPQEEGPEDDQNQQQQRQPFEPVHRQSLHCEIEQLTTNISQMRKEYQNLDLEEQKLKRNRNKQLQPPFKPPVSSDHREPRLFEHIKSVDNPLMHPENGQKRSRKQKLKQKPKIERNHAFGGEKNNRKMRLKVLQDENLKKKFYMQKAQEDRLLRQQEKQHVKLILSQRKQKYRPMDFQLIEHHQRKYAELLVEMTELKKSQRQNAKMKINSENEQQKQRYKGHSHQLMKEEELQRQLKKSQAYEKNRKMKNYRQYIREHFQPKTDDSHNESLDHDQQFNSTHRQIKRYRYYKGQAKGQIYESYPITKSDDEKRKIGNNYMEYMKHLPKKKTAIDEQEFSTQDMRILNNKLNSITRVKQQRHSIYEKSGRKSLEVKLSEQPTREEVRLAIDKLMMQDQHNRMQEKILRSGKHSHDTVSRENKKISNDIVENIQRKLNLLSRI